MDTPLLERPLVTQQYPINPFRAEYVANATAESMAHPMDSVEPPPPMSEEEAVNLIRRCLSIQREIEEIEANAKALVKERQEKLEWVLAYAGEDRIQAFVAQQARKNARSWKCLFGTLGMRTTPAGWKVEDEATAIEYAKAREIDGAVVERLVLAKLPKPSQVPDEATGELVYQRLPGLDVRPEKTTVYVKANAKGPGEGADGE